jgi:hypothetical protein
MDNRKITKNAIRCKHCFDVIESKRTHDFATCKCGICSVDGGHEYVRVTFATTPENDFEYLTEYED